MHEKTLFRLLLKVVGVLLFVQGLSTSLNLLIGLGRAFFVGGAPGMGWVEVLAWSGPGLLQLGAGLYLFFGGRALADLALPSNRPRCHECGYELGPNLPARCSECGAPVELPGAGSDPETTP